MVVSADYLERGLAAQALGSKVVPSAAQDSAIMRSSLEQVLSLSGAPGPLHGVADAGRVAAVGHSAGGGTAFDALGGTGGQDGGRLGPGGAVDRPVHQTGDAHRCRGGRRVPPATVRKTYASFPGPRSLVEISGEGHNTYTDICTGIRSGGGLISYAVSAHLVTPTLARFGINGCEASDPAPQRFWPIVQYYTVFQLRSQFAGRTTAPVPVPAPGTFPASP